MIQSLNTPASTDQTETTKPEAAQAESPNDAPAKAKRGPRVSKSKARHYARGRAMQALYQRELNGLSIVDIESQFLEDQDMKKVDMDFFLELLHKVPAQISELDAELEPCLDVPIIRLDPVERCILRIATYEFMHRPDVPWKVVLNEAVELAKTFGAEQGHRFVNGVLDKLGRKLRQSE